MSEVAPRGAAPPLKLAALVLLLIAGFAVIPRVLSRHGNGLGREAPDFALKVVANGSAAPGEELKLSNLRGQAVVLDFWATWCGPCRVEAPIVNKVVARYKDRGVVAVGVNTSDEPDLAAPWVKRHGIAFPIVYDERNQAARAYGVENLPTLVVISRNGKILATRTGVTDDAELDALIKEAL